MEREGLSEKGTRRAEQTREYGERTNTESFRNTHMGTYHYRRFLKYICRKYSQRNHSIIGNIAPNRNHKQVKKKSYARNGHPL